MGLDVSFNRKAALEAGLVLQQSSYTYFNYGPNNEEIPVEVPETIIAVPGCDHFVADDGNEESIIVRANKWGRTYAPLTEWLKANNISWEEF